MAHNRYDDPNKKLKILVQPNIGMDSDDRQPVVDILNNTLANEALLTAKNPQRPLEREQSGFLRTAHPF